MPTLLKPEWVSHSSKAITSVDIHPSNEYFCTTGEDGNVKIWNLEPLLKEKKDVRKANRCLSQISIPDRIAVARFSRNGDFLACGTGEGRLQVYKRDIDKFEWNLFSTYQNHILEINDLAWTPDDRFIVTCGLDSKLCATSFSNEVETNLWELSERPLGLSISPGGDVIAVQMERSVALYKLSTSQQMSITNEGLKHSSTKIDNKRPSWDPLGLYLATCTGETSEDKPYPYVNSVFKFHGQGLKPSFNFGNVSHTLSIKCSPIFYKSQTGEYSFVCVTANTQGALTFFSIAKGLMYKIDRLFENCISDHAWTSDGSAVLTVSLDGTLSVVILDKDSDLEKMTNDEIRQLWEKYHTTPMPTFAFKSPTKRQSKSNGSQEKTTPKEGKKRISPEVLSTPLTMGTICTFSPPAMLPPKPQSITNSPANPPFSDHSQEKKPSPTTKAKTSSQNKTNDANVKSEKVPEVSSRTLEVMSLENMTTSTPTQVSPSKKDSPKKSQNNQISVLETENGANDKVIELSENEEEKLQSKKKKADKKRKRESDASKAKKRVKSHENEDELFDMQEEEEEEVVPEHLDPLPIPEKLNRHFKRIGKGIFIEVAYNEASKESKIEITKTDKKAWSQIIEDRISTLAGNTSYCCFGSFSGDVYIYNMAGRRIFPCLTVSSFPISFVLCEDQMSLVASADGEIRLWDLVEKCVLVSCSCASLVKSYLVRVLKIGICQKSVFVALNNGNVYYYDLSLKTWIQAYNIQYNASEYAMNSKSMISKPVQMIQTITALGVPNIGIIGGTSEESKKSRSLAFLEDQIAISETIQSPDEYKMWLEKYVLKLSEEFQESKLEELLDSFLGPTYAPSELTPEEEKQYGWKCRILGFSKRKLLKDLFKIILTNKSLQGLITRYNTELEAIPQLNPTK